MAKQNNEEIFKDLAICKTCHDHGFRIEIMPGWTLNAKAAEINGLLKNKKITCQCQEQVSLVQTT